MFLKRVFIEMPWTWKTFLPNDLRQDLGFLPRKSSS
jgi:hypothetical protein